MASEYLKKKYRDVKPDAPLELTKTEKWKNWWHYYKWHVGIALVLLAITGSIMWNTLSRAEPDYKIAYVGSSRLPEDTAAALEAAFASLGEDLNGDGEIAAALTQYVSDSGTPDMSAAAQVSLMGDILECESYFFLLEDPEQFQREYHSLRRLDGSLPEKGEDSLEETCLVWGSCPVLAGFDLGEYAYEWMGSTVTGGSQELVSALYLARRGFWTEKTSAYPEGCDALWSKLTEGAVS